MADLLGRLETGLQRAAGASERLRSQVDRIDGYMTSRPINLQTAHHPPNPPEVPVDAKPNIAMTSVPYVPPSGPPGPAPGAPPNAMGDQMMQFQIPPELLSDWPWPLDGGGNPEGFLPMAFE
jgi:hypothetical protein